MTRCATGGQGEERENEWERMEERKRWRMKGEGWGWKENREEKKTDKKAGGWDMGATGLECERDSKQDWNS